MHLDVFSIRDSKAKLFLSPFFSPNIATAERSFAAAVNDENTDFHRYASDYDLYKIGFFNQTTGKLTGSKAPTHIGSAFIYYNHEKFPVIEEPENAYKTDLPDTPAIKKQADGTYKSPTADKILESINP